MAAHHLFKKYRMCNHSALQVAYGTAENRGHRSVMEDVLCKEQWQDDFRFGGKDYSVEFLLLGVCDGHVDDGRVGNFVASNIASILRKSMKEITGEGAEIDRSSAEYWNTVWRKACVTVDAELEKEKLFGGSTGVFALISDKFIVVANVGDSRCILLQGEGTVSLPSTVKPLSFDHKPHDPVEYERVTKAGMTIKTEIYFIGGVETAVSRLFSKGLGSMSVSRAFGDFEFKGNDKFGPEGQAVCCIPDVVVHQRDKKDCFLILASDGVWDVMSNDAMNEFLVEQVKIKTKAGITDSILSDIANALVEACLHRGSMDNISTIIVSLQPSDGQV